MDPTEKPTGTFRDNPRWNDDRMAVEFHLDLRWSHETKAILCRVSRAALDDLARRTGPLSASQAIALYRRFQDRIHTAADRKLKRAAFDGDGSITISSGDLN